MNASLTDLRTAAKVCFILIFAPCLWGQSPESLNALIEKSITQKSGFMRPLMKELLPGWEGIKTVAGLNLILNKHLSGNTTPDENMACYYLLMNLQLPKDQVAEAMMQRARLEAANEAEPWRLVYVLRQMVKMIDLEKQGPVAVPFIAQYLTDQRFTEEQQRGEGSTPRQRRRVCDGATSTLINYLEETGLCQKYDSRFGDPGGHTMWAQRDQVSRAVVQVLQEKNLLPLNFWETASPPRLPAPSLTLPLAPVLESKKAGGKDPSQETNASAASSGPESLMSVGQAIALLIVASASSTWWLLRRKKTVP